MPSSLIIIGAGYVGVEFAQMYGRYGARVTLLSRSERIMKQEEPELSIRLAELLRTEGIDVQVGATAKRAEKTGDEKTIVAEIDGQPHRFQAEEILFAAGRVPRVDGLGLTEAGVEMDSEGIQVVTAMYNKGTAESLYRSIHVHPTLSETVKDAAKGLR